MGPLALSRLRGANVARGGDGPSTTYNSKRPSMEFAYGNPVRFDHRVRRLVVGEVTWLWSVRQRAKPVYEDCQLTLSLRPDGTRGRLILIFRPDEDRIISNAWFEAGALVRLPDRSYLNLYEPGTVRRLLDAAAANLDISASGQVLEVDGWPYFDAIVDSGVGM